MKRWTKLFLTTLVLTLTLSMTAMAGQWKQDQIGWWYQNDDGSWYADCWQWIDGNGDGVAECYYFAADGYLVVDGIADGYTVNSDGAWTENGVVQRKAVIDPSNDREAMAIYQAAQEKYAALDYAEADTSYVMDMEMEGISMEVVMNTNLKMANIRGEDLQYLMTGTMKMLGAEFPVTIFYKDGWYYMDMMDMKVKQPMDLASAIEAINENTGATEVSTAMMRNLKATQTQNGEYTVLTYDVSESVLNSYLQAALAQTGTTDAALSSYKVNSANGTTVLDKNGNYVQDQVIMDMEMSVYDPQNGTYSDAKYTMDMIMDYKNLGQPVTLTFPSTEGYTDITAQ